jgi:hypothetical protein
MLNIIICLRKRWIHIRQKEGGANGKSALGCIKYYEFKGRHKN